MKILFTLLSIDAGYSMYLQSAKRLAKELLKYTTHDIFISTNNLEYFRDIQNNRCKVRDNIREDSILLYGNEFNYNLKHHAFVNIPEDYDLVVYLDCDLKLNKWDNASERLLQDLLKSYDFGADRLNCILGQEVDFFKKNQPCLFQHKINSYDILQKYSMQDDIMNSKLPSEHFLVLKNEPEKIKRFQQKWEELNNYLQNKKGEGGSWGDGFEIGISARYAGYEKFFNISASMWKEVLGLEFNGNKFLI